ncbi:MAG: tol-pal system protein YbgF [Desulfuromonadales bacterium]|nr:tol-pal system protein YbgF [Desulfuromonadales bacterium]
MVSGSKWIACCISCLALTGCAANDLMVKRQAETDAKVEHLIQSAKKNDQRSNELADQFRNQGDQTKAAAAQFKQLENAVREVRQTLDELNARVTLLALQNATPKIEVVNQEPALKGRDTGPPAEYLKAFGLYSANNFAEAIPAFEAFMKNHPQSDYVANALYWIGECYYSMSDLPKSKEIFFRVAGTYPNSSKAPDALLKLGYTLAAMKEKDKATAIFESLIKSYPSSPAAAKARERLTAN